MAGGNGGHVPLDLEAFAKAAAGGPAYPIPFDQMIHGVAVTEAIIRSARLVP